MTGTENCTRLVLEDFIPFRLNRLADAVSEDLSEIYRQVFHLEIAEWRVLVTVGQQRSCTAQHVAASTRMHKTRVSRAVGSLEKRALIERVTSAADARSLPLRLSRSGRRVYAALVPQALKRERRVLSCLSDSERAVFRQVLMRLEKSLGLNDDDSWTDDERP